MKKLHQLFFALLCVMPVLAIAKSTFDIAHFREQGEDLVIIVMPRGIDDFPTSDKELLFNEFKKCAKEARLSGSIAMVWNKPGTMGIYGPTRWMPFLKSINMKYVKDRVNKELTCDD
jgi:hypothetical protein